jgi:mannose-6-phosphate isomerase-like protein (cupin superfamily)
MVPASLLEIHEYRGQGYLPLINYNGWRVAVLRYIEELLPDKIDKMQRHSETDEVFVLLKGRCILFLGEGDEQIHTIYAQDIEPLKLYNVQRNSWHTHTLSEDATVLIVENEDTNLDNSPEIILKPEQRVELISLTENLWKDTEAK